MNHYGDYVELSGTIELIYKGKWVTKNNGMVFGFNRLQRLCLWYKKFWHRDLIDHHVLVQTSKLFAQSLKETETAIFEMMRK